MLNLVLATQEVNQGGLISSLMMFVLIGVAFYFMILRPQKKQQQKMQETMESLKVGDHIVTRAGVRGVIVQLKGDSVIIETGPDKTTFELLKQAVSHVEAGTESSESPYLNQPVGDLSYGNDVRFIEKLNELKDKDNSNMDYDLLLEDVYEFVVLEGKSKTEDVQATFRLDKERADLILDQLEDVGALSTKNMDGTRSVLIDPRQNL